MQHHFNTDIAKKYDIITAILLDNFYYWIEKNRINNKHYHDGKWWTYNSRKAMQEWFPYLTTRQIDYAIKKMVEENLIITSNYNDKKQDRTLWYAITNFGYSILQNCEMYNNIYITNTNTNTKEINKESLEDNGKVTDDDIYSFFDKVYAIYPRKVNKVQAKTTFSHKLKSLTKDEAHNKAVAIYRLLQAQIALWQKENDGQGRKVEHIPHFSTWLNSNVEDSIKNKRR